MLAKLEQAMSGWGSERPEVPPVPKPDYTPQPGLYLINKPEVNQCRVSIGELGVMRDNPDHYALAIMNHILGGGVFTSWIGSRVRDEQGLAYDARTTMTPGVYYDGVFRAFFQSKSATCAQAADIVIQQINRIRKEKVSPADLATAVNYEVEIFPRFFATPSIVAATFAADEYTRRPANYWETYRDHLRAVTADDILRVAQKYLHPGRLVMLAVGNLDDVLKGDPNHPQYSFRKLAEGMPIERLPLPDPVTMAYPKPEPLR
jgi:predicted Zn-dependent peptidase